MAMLQHSVVNEQRGLDWDSSSNQDSSFLDFAEAEAEDAEEDAEEEDAARAGFLVTVKVGGNPPPEGLTFQAGEAAEMNVIRCHPAEYKTKCQVKSVGDQPGTFNVFVFRNPEKHRDVWNVPAETLRSDSEEPKSVGVGDIAWLLGNECLGGGSWVPVTVEGPAANAGTYNVNLAEAQFPGVPLVALRKVQEVKQPIE